MANATEVAARWAANARNNVQKYKDGVASVTQSPMAAAAAAQDKYLAGIQRAVADGSYRDGLLSVSLSDWKARTADVGAQRFTQGVTAAQGKMAEFMSALLPFTDAVSKQIQSMPSGTLEDSIARATATIVAMSKFKKPAKRAVG